MNPTSAIGIPRQLYRFPESFSFLLSPAQGVFSVIGKPHCCLFSLILESCSLRKCENKAWFVRGRNYSKTTGTNRLKNNVKCHAHHTRFLAKSRAAHPLCTSARPIIEPLSWEISELRKCHRIGGECKTENWKVCFPKIENKNDWICHSLCRSGKLFLPEGKRKTLHEAYLDLVTE